MNFLKNSASTLASMGRLMDYLDYCEDTGTKIDVEEILVYAIPNASYFKRLVEHLDARGRKLDIKFRERSGKTPLQLADDNDHYEICQLIYAYKIKQRDAELSNPEKKRRKNE